MNKIALKTDATCNGKKAGKGGVIPPKEHRFSKKNQPGPQAKARGLRQWHERNRLKDNIASVFAEEIQNQDGTAIIGMDALAKRLRDYFLQVNLKKMSSKQADLGIKLVAMLSPEENKVDLTLKTEKISEENLKQIMVERVNASKQNAPGNTK